LITAELLKAPQPLRHYVRVLGVGGARCGTTYLHQMITSFPEACSAGIKEHHFYDSIFASKDRPGTGWSQEQISDVTHAQCTGALREQICRLRASLLAEPANYWQQYQAYVDAFPQRYSHLVDITPAYSLLTEEQLVTMFAAHPRTKIVMLLRDPVDRFWSGAKKQAREHGVAPESVVEQEIARLRNRSGHTPIQIRKSELGTLAANVKAAAERAGDSVGLYFGFHEQIFGPEGPSHLRRIFDFLGLHGECSGDTSERINTTDETPVPEAVRHLVMPAFQQQYDQCFELFGESFIRELWPVRQRVQERTSAPAPQLIHRPRARAIPELPPTTAQRPAAAARLRSAPSEVDYARLIRFKNRYAGGECVLLCNGPSLRSVDFAKIRSHFLVGLNKIYLGTELIGRVPDCVVCVNQKVLQQSAAQLAAMRTLKFLGSRAGSVIPADPLTYYFNSTGPKPARFSTDIVDYVHEGWTVTHAALQVLYYMGFRKVVIVGMDHNFPDAKGSPNEGQLMAQADTNHFTPDYFGFGQQWDLPDLANSEISYSAAREAYEADGRIIIDATEQGHCRIFERMRLVDALAYPIPR